MKKEDLIKQLQALPDGVEVCLMDWRKNLNGDSGEGSSTGMYPKFEIGMMDKDEIPDNAKPFAVITFENDDYKDDGNARWDDEGEVLTLESENKELKKIYLAAVKGRQDFREAFRKQREENESLKEELLRARENLSETLAAYERFKP